VVSIACMLLPEVAVRETLPRPFRNVSAKH
jgi:hypothetical protein